MKRFAAVAAGALVLAACQDNASEPLAPTAGTSDAVAVDGLKSTEYVPGQVIVKFRKDVNAVSVAHANGGKIEKQLLPLVHLLRVPSGRELAVVAALRNNPNVEYAEPDYIRRPAIACGTGDCVVPTDLYFGYKWDHHNDGTINNSTGLLQANTTRTDADIDWIEAHNQLGAFTGSAVVSIIDTGVLSTHPDLSGKVLAGYDFVNNDNNPNDDDGHGTHVAGIAAAHGNNGLGVTGVAYGANVKILPVKVCGPAGCPTSAIVSGIRYAADNGANVINLSLGGRFGSASEQSALQYALSKDVLPFCASGNDGSKRTLSYPAAFPECVAVGSTDWGDTKSSFSNGGSGLDIAAPGGDSENSSGYSYILSTYNDGGYAFVAGTSQASPQAAGLAALLYAQGLRGAANIRSRIEGTVDDLGQSGLDTSFGRGRINVYKAINNIR
ncbi:MAG TPA: S8 family serine peptidase [Longimicrobium sp.]|nr:S8 family serine peptidase [Longimicrobium sp.]